MKNLSKILLCNIAGIAIFLSWFIPGKNGLWFTIDSKIFFFFNHLLAENKAFLYFVATVNFRAFDVLAFVAMLLLFYSYYRKQDRVGKRWMLCIGITMLITAVIAKQCGSLLPVHHPSPTAYFNSQHMHVNFHSVMTGWPTKDRSGDSFPGDHGMFLLIFAVYMWKYFGGKAFLKAFLIFLIFAAPRVMGGGHWFTDIAVGSISIVLVTMSWMLMTPFADKIVGFLEKKIPLKFWKE